MALSEKQHGRTWTQVIVYDVLRVWARVVMPVLFRFRAYGREYYPETGGALICSNHQSHFDPVFVGLTCNRRMSYVARKSLFKSVIFRWIIEFLDAIPIDRDGGGASGLKETLKRLKRGEVVLIFPEGTRTPNGKVGRLKPGFCALARRSKVPIIPVGFDGAYEAWSRKAKVPRFAAVTVEIGEPIYPHQFDQYDDDQLLDEVERRMKACYDRAHRNCVDGVTDAYHPF